MSFQQQQSLEQQVHVLTEENRALRAELARLEQESRAARESRERLLRGGGRLLLPLLDRQRVVRSFAKLTATTSAFAGPMSGWPTRDQVIVDAREFLESCVRFAIRRRTMFLLFSLIAATVPAIQIWLVVQQNEIIENQNAFAEIQVYDVVARSMTEGDRNAKQITGALLANARFDFLQGVVEEAFTTDLVSVYGQESVGAVQRRLEDAAFRGHLIRAVVQGVERQSRKGLATPDELYAQARPMFRQILRETADRLPQVLQLGRKADQLDDALAEQVDLYLVQVGSLLRVYSRLARTMENEAAFFDDARPLFQRLAGLRSLDQSRFYPVYQAIMQDFLFDLGQAPGLDAPPVNLEAKGLAPEQALRQGLDRLRKGLGDQGINWAQFEQQIAI